MSLRKSVSRIAGIYVILIVTFVVSLWLVSALPNSWMTAAVESYSNTWEQEYVEGGYPEPLFGSSQSALDIYTDNAMYYRLMVDEGMRPLEAAMDMKDYTRYWHGYLVILKPLSIFFSYVEIRYLNMFIVNLLFFLSALVLYKYTKRLEAVCAYVVALTSTFLIVAPISFQYMSSYVGMFLMVLAVIGNDKKQILHRNELFFACGMCINFFDFLTFPVITLGIPLIVLILLEMTESVSSVMKEFWAVIRDSVFWMAGYAGCWISKWVLGSLILRRNIIRDAVEQASFRISGDAEHMTTPLEALRRNVSMLNYMELSPKWLLVLGLMIVAAGFGLWKMNKNRLGQYLLILMISMYPYIWYAVLSNHSEIHYFFTFRAQAITVFGALTVFFGIMLDLWHYKNDKGKRDYESV